MYFTNKEPENNYLSLIGQYDLVHNENLEYEPQIYIAALPDIYKIFNQESLQNEDNGPLQRYTQEELGKELGHREYQLTGATQLAASLIATIKSDLATCLVRSLAKIM